MPVAVGPETTELRRLRPGPRGKRQAMDIGEPKREIVIEPIEDPVPREAPIETPVEPATPEPDRAEPARVG